MGNHLDEIDKRKDMFLINRIEGQLWIPLDIHYNLYELMRKKL